MVSPRTLLALTKPRIAGLLCLTGVTASFAAGGLAPPTLLAFAVAGLGMAGGAAALNCYYDRDIDPAMSRTADRPLARDALSPRVALAFGVALLAASTALALATLPAVAVGYMWLGVAAYVGLYTVLLKRRHWLGVVLGGSAGSFPVLAGWTTVRPLEPAALVMALFVFAWTPAHAWALAVVYRDDFAAVDVPTLPVVASERRVRRAVWVSALSAVAVGAALLPLAGLNYAAAFLVGAPLFVFVYDRFRRFGGDARAVRAFFTSNVFLATAFLGWGVGGLTDSGPVAVATGAATLVLFVGTWHARPALDGVRSAPVDPPSVAVRAYDRLRLCVPGW